MKKLANLDWFIENNTDSTNNAHIEYYEPPIYVVQPHEDDELFFYVQEIFKKAKQDKRC